MGDWELRSRAVLNDYFVVAVAVAIVITLLGGWLIFSTVVDPGTVTETRQIPTWESTGEYGHEAEVVRSNRVFPTGTVLQDRSMYYTQLMPELRGDFTYGFDAASGELEVRIDSTLVVHAVGDEGQEFWRIEEPLDSTTATLGPGETASTEFTINVTEVRSEIQGVESDLGASPGETVVEVQSVVRAEGDPAGRQVSQRRTYGMTVSPGQATYSVDGDGRQTDSEQRVEEVTRDRTYGPLRTLSGPLAVLLGLGAIGGLFVGRERDYFHVSETERVRMGFAEEREEFDDWISRGSIPEEARDRPEIRIDELEDLVDLAIDSDARVIEEVGEERYYALADGFCYVFEPPAAVQVADLHD